MSIRSKRARRVNRRLIALRKVRWLLRYDFARADTIVPCGALDGHPTVMFHIPEPRPERFDWFSCVSVREVVLDAHLLRGEVGLDRDGPIVGEALLYLERGKKPSDADCMRAERAIRRLSSHKQRGTAPGAPER